MLKEFSISTSRKYQLVNITEKVEKVVVEAKVKEGVVLVFVPHSTAGILLTEEEEGLKRDWLKLFEKIVSGLDFEHNRIDNNADAHLLSGLIGQSKVLPIKEGKLVRGTWQEIFLAEFDGPRERKVIVEIVN
ncbi:MAG: secondary thiamine-phosphate synthase enzyme YjbQ [candidate division WOR-3 bacterium]